MWRCSRRGLTAIDQPMARGLRPPGCSQLPQPQAHIARRISFNRPYDFRIQSRSFSLNPAPQSNKRSPASTSSKVEDGFPLPLPRALAARSALLLLSVPVPPIHWPSHLDIASPLLSRTSKILLPRGIAVNAIYDGISNLTMFPKPEEEVYPARLFFPDGKVFRYESFSRSSLEDADFLRDAGYRPSTSRLEVSMKGSKSRSGSGSGSGLGLEATQAGAEDMSGEAEIVICTHGSRDCRCSDRGGALVEALREEIVRRGVGGKVRVSEVAHVGGHKYAANAILLPSLDMLGNLLPSHAPSLLSHVLAGCPPSSHVWQHWRGRYGLSEEEQAAVWGNVEAYSRKDNSDYRPSVPETKSDRGLSNLKESTKEVQLVFKTWEGEVKHVTAKSGETLLEVARREGLPSMEGVCGGNLECATCHVYLTSPPTALPPVAEPSEEEDDMLGYALGFRDGESRLGCQIKVDEKLGKWCAEGGVLGLPRF